MQKKTVRRKRTKTSNKKAQVRLKSEAAGLILIALGILLGLSIFFENSAGPMGEVLGKIVGGLFGLSAFAIPFLIILHGLIKIFRPEFLFEDRRFSLILVLLILFSAMFQSGLHDISHYENMNLGQYLKSFYREGVAAIGKGNEFMASGGVFGGIVGVPLLMVFRKWGTMVILITLAVIDGMLITRLSIAEIARSAARNTSEAINGVVGAAKRKLEKRNLNRTKEYEEASEPVSRSSSRRKNKILDFPLIKEEKENVSDLSENTNDVDFTINDVSIGNQEMKPELTVLAPETSVDDEAVQTEQVNSHDDANNSVNPSDHSGGNDVTDGDPEISYSEDKETSYIFPPTELLTRSKDSEKNIRRLRSSAIENAKKLEETLSSFGIGAKVINVSVGPAFTRYELQPAPGVKVSRIVNLTDDIALNLAATGIRIEAPIPGKAAVGVEVPNKEVAPINIRSVLESREFQEHSSCLAVALGKDISGENVVIDLAKMPHILIAGATGSGKSVCINSIVTSILYKASPQDVKLLMIDPKVVELGVYNGIPHLLIPVVTDPNKAAGALRWAVSEMTTRYKLFADKGVRDLLGYNAIIEETGEGMKLPQIVIIIDELADLMMVAPHDVEDSICRLAQMARAAGMHLVIATQRPSVNVITGVIKANIPSRISFAVSSQVDSRTILDMAGAEKLLGKGDMLYYPVGIPKPIRVKGVFVSDKEVEQVVEFVKNQVRAHYDEEIIENINENVKNEDKASLEDDVDELLEQAIDAVIDCGQASVSFIQRKFKVGYARAGRIIDQMEERNIISGYEGSKPRRVLISREQWEEMKLSRSGDEL
ncbi:MAG: DNA translocase FtsK [Clostridiaceae bacterium]|nr:DNA translocase FtsK [Clostridiaceae bacterium]